MDTNRERRRNKCWPEALKREVVAASMALGASVSVVARQYDVNANQVFGWRRRYRATERPRAPALSTPGLVPVTITLGPDDEVASPPAPAASETIGIEVGGDYRGGQRAAAMYSMIVTAKMNDIDLQARLADVLARIASHPTSRLAELLPWNWIAAKADAQAA